MPKVVMQSITVPDAALIHHTLISMARQEKKKFNGLGGTSESVKNITMAASKVDGIRQMSNIKMVCE